MTITPANDVSLLSSNSSIPKQLIPLLKDVCVKERDFILDCYSGKKSLPSFQEWTEEFQQAWYFKSEIESSLRIKRLVLSVDEQRKLLEVVRSNPSTDRASFEYKDLERELSRRERLLSNAEAHWERVSKELTRAVQETLRREAPKKLEVSHKTIPLSEIHKIMRGDGDEVFDADFKEVKD